MGQSELPIKRQRGRERERERERERGREREREEKTHILPSAEFSALPGPLRFPMFRCCGNQGRGVSQSRRGEEGRGRREKEKKKENQLISWHGNRKDVIPADTL